MNVRTRIQSLLARVRSIPHPDHTLNAENWCQVQPCVTIRIGTRSILITQPTSSLLVYGLGLVGLGVGGTFLTTQGEQASRLWWGIGLLLWGAGALVAGTSYQAFAFQIKCANRPAPSWTSWWEVIYLILQQASISALLVAGAYSSTQDPLRGILLAVALLSGLIYAIMVLAGALIPDKRLISFELLVWVAAPMVAVLACISLFPNFQTDSIPDLAQAAAWLALIPILVGYYLYLGLELTGKLWKGGQGIWFSENDLLHVGLLLWMGYLAWQVLPRVVDLG